MTPDKKPLDSGPGSTPGGCATLFGPALLVVSSFLAFFSCWARIDSLEDRFFLQAWDIFLGLFFAASVLLLRAGAKSKGATLCLVVAAWVFVSGFFLLIHEAQVRIRWTAATTGLARNQVMRAQAALQEYARDCGGLPPDEKGLAALHTNPGVKGWAGPYLEAKWLTDPWGNLLQYRVRGDRAEVWSNGPDGQGGTEDDIRQAEP